MEEALDLSSDRLLNNNNWLNFTYEVSQAYSVLVAYRRFQDSKHVHNMFYKNLTERVYTYCIQTPNTLISKF